MGKKTQEVLNYKDWNVFFTQILLKTDETCEFIIEP